MKPTHEVGIQIDEASFTFSPDWARGVARQLTVSADAADTLNKDQIHG